MKNALGVYEKALLSDQSWEEKFRAARGAGFDFIEFSVDASPERLARLDWSKAAAAELRALAAQMGMPFFTMAFTANRSFPLGAYDREIRRTGIKLAEKAARLAHELGVSVMHLAAYDIFPGEGDALSDRNFKNSMAACAEIAAECGVMLALELMDHPYSDTCGKLLAHISEARSPWLGIYYDMGNAAAQKQDNMSEICAGTGRIVGVHIKDGMPGRCRNVPFGSGTVDFAACLSALSQTGYRGPLTVEMWSDETPEALTKLTESAAFVRRHMNEIKEKAYA